MGGKIWSDKEERYFWKIVIPRSPKRIILVDDDGLEAEQEQGAAEDLSWAELAAEMNSALEADARREYTGSMLFEHYFLNIEQQRVSPNAGRYVHKYLKSAGMENHTLLRNTSSARPSARARVAEVRENHRKSRSPPVQARTRHSTRSETRSTVVFTAVPHGILDASGASSGHVLPSGTVEKAQRQ